MSSARNNILQSIAVALHKPTEIPFHNEEDLHSVFLRDGEDLEAMFTTAFTILDGKVFVCDGKKELLDNLKTLAAEKKWSNIYCKTPSLINDLQLESLPFVNKGKSDEVEAGITDCECLVARTGTIVLSATQPSGRTLPVHVPIHLVIAGVNNLVFDIGDAINMIQRKYPGRLPSALFFASGPSRTADIEKRLVLGVHGPKEVYLFLLKDEFNSD